MHADEPPLTGDPHPEVWDLICVGTGLAETMLASAAARAGKSVLHLDPADAYGGAFGALAESPGGVGWDVPSSADLERRAAMRDRLASDFFADEDAEDAVVFPALGAPVDARARLGATSYCSPATPSGSSRRQFCLDRSGPRLALGADAFVDLLVRSGAHKYVEFKALDATNIRARDGEIEAVPASRAEVFRDKTLSLAEKRALMRVLKHVVRVAERDGTVVGAGDPDAADAAVGAPGSEWRAGSTDASESSADAFVEPLYEREDELFSAALERLGLGQETSASIAVQFALALSGDESETARRGFASLTTYLASLHRFGKDVGAALVPLYGASEFPQAFARLAAVHGATYALRVGVRRVKFLSGDPSKSANSKVLTVVTTGGQRLACRALAAGDAAVGVAAAATRWVSRMTAVVDGACVPEKNKNSGDENASRDETTLLVFPPGSVRGAPAGAATRVAQLSAATGACPRGARENNQSGGYRVLHASVASRDPARSAEDELRGVLELLADTESLRGYDKRTEDDSARTVDEDEESIASGKTRRRNRKPRAVWVSFHREVAAEDVRGVLESWASLPGNVVTCPGPDARADFADLVAVAEAAHARLWGEDKNGLFPAAPRAGEEGDASQGAAQRRGTRTEDSDEDEMDALLRDLPGGIGA